LTPTWLALRTDWNWHSVRELQDEGVLLVEDGNHGEYRPVPNEFTDDGTAFIRAADLADGQILFSTAGHINDVALRRIRKGIGKPGDVLFSHKGTVGKLAMANHDAPAFVCSPQTTFWRVTDPTRLDRQFLFAYMRAPEFQRQWTVRKGDTDMADYVSLTAQRTLLVPLPPLSTQRKVAVILSAYDDLIENNNRRIEVLEEMARRIYREWFVEFRYPGHENVPFIDSELGRIPKGWTVRGLFDIAHITFGFPFKSDLFNADQGLPILRIRDIPVGESATRTTQSAGAAYRVADGDILVGMDGDFHMGRWSAGDAWLNQRVARLRVASDTICRYALYLSLEKPIKDWNGAIVGTTVAHLGKRHLELIKVLTPTPALAAIQAASLDPIFDLEIGLRKATRHLRLTRDHLLPRLMSGEIDVTDLDISMPAAAA
jgi:type I restriction enzyme, S subunit